MEHLNAVNDIGYLIIEDPMFEAEVWFIG